MQYKTMWPDNKRFAVCLTHDVDRVKKTYQYITHSGKGGFLEIWQLFTSKNPYWNHKTIMEIEDKFGVRSSFFFLQESKKTNLMRPDEWALSAGKYKFIDKKVGEIIQVLDRNGWEIGLHGSYDSYRKIALLKREKALLENVAKHPILGVRQHYLNLNVPETWNIQKNSGFKYDSSFGLTNNIGFRDDKFFPFRPFNDDFLVIPLTIMDSYLFGLSKDIQEAWTKVEGLLSLVEKHGALLTVLWHQRVFNEKEFPGYSILYERLIERSIEMDSWIAKCIDVYNWVSKYK